MTLFTLIKKDEIHLTPNKKIISAEAFSHLVEAIQIASRTQEEAVAYKLEIAKECELLKEQAEEAGFEKGLESWSAQINLLEEEIRNVRQEMENTIVPLALTAVKKIIGRELLTQPETVVDIVATALKSVAHHRRITIYVNQNDLDAVEEQKPRLKALFEHLETLSVVTRDDVQPGGCIIETEAGIINAQLDNQLQALEAAFRNFFQNKKKGRS